MKGLPYARAVALAFLTAGFITLSFAQGKSEEVAKERNAMPSMSNTPPPLLVGFPDIEYVPVYPGATVTFTNTEAAKLNNVTYEVDARIEKVTKFYDEMLPKKGWVLRNSVNRRNMYSWAQPEGKPLWGMQLEVVIGLTLDQSRTVVELEYGRYPSRTEDLPLYPDAQQVSVTHSQVEKSFAGGKTPIQVTDIVYVSSANPQDIASYYQNSMQEYGWYDQGRGWSTQEYAWSPFDDFGSWEGFSQQEGLYFVASRPRWGEKSGIVSSHLLATATLDQNGLTVIKLHVEEYESVSDF